VPAQFSKAQPNVPRRIRERLPPANNTMIADVENSVCAVQGASTFRNPIAAGADPWVVRHDGCYYWCASDGESEVAVYRSERLTEFGEKFIVWRAPATGPLHRQLWAPELHCLDGRWYIYVAASNGRNETHRMIVLESRGESPTSEFRFKAELYTGDDIATGRRNRWAIDGTILERKGARYFVWSGWRDTKDEQRLYIARMENPWTIATNRVCLCANDDFIWERVGETREGRGLNEGPQVLCRDGKVFVVYSASGSWEPSYKLGLLELIDGGDPMNPGAWRKHAEPVLAPTKVTWGVGHCSFTVSPDGREDWIVYHAKIERTPGWNRDIRMQRFYWDAAGRPVFGAPVNADATLPLPGGDFASDLSSTVTQPVHETGASGATEVALGRAALAALGEQPMIERVDVVET
jgi:GH43 family beta-xylosidase